MVRIVVSQDVIKKMHKIFDAEPSTIEETAKFKNIGHPELIEVFSGWAKRHEDIFRETIKIDKTHGLQEHGVDFVIHLITSNRKIGVQVECYSDIKQKDFTKDLNTQIVNSKTYDLECFCVIFCGDMTDKSQNQKISGRISHFQKTKDSYVQSFDPQKAMTVYNEFKAGVKRFGDVPISEPLPAIDNFVGREKYLEKVRDAIKNKKVTIIQGVAGIGKTYIAAKIARELQPQKKLFWHTFPETGDSFDLVTDKLSKFFANYGDSALLDYIREGGADINEKMHAIINSLEQGDYLMFFDNYQYVTDENIHELFRMLTSKGSKARGIVITRRIPPIYETWDKVSIAEQKIEGLDLKESKELFEVLELSIDEDAAAKAHKLTKGHPISLNTFTVLAKESTPDKVLQEITEYKENVDKYLLKEVYNKSTKEEQKLLRVASIFQRAVPARAYKIVLGKRFSKKVLEGLKNRFLLKMKKEDKTYYPHDLIKDFAYKQLKEKDRKGYHAKAADYFRRIEKTPENILSAYYHLDRAGLRDEGFEFLRYVGSEIIKKQGYWREYIAKLQEIADYLNRKGEIEKVGYTYNEIGFTFLNLGELIEALKYFKMALQNAEILGEENKIATCYNNIGMIYHDRGELDKALGYYQKASKIGEELGDKGGIATNYNNIGEVYRTRGELDKALEYYQKALKSFEELGDKRNSATVGNNIGLIYDDWGEKDKALEYYQRALRIDEELGDKAGITTDYNNIGSIYQDRGELDKASEYYQKSLEILEELGDKPHMATCYNNIALIHEEWDNLDKAIEFFERSLELYILLGNPKDVTKGYENLIRVYSSKGDVKKAEECEKKLLEFKKHM